MNEFEIFTAALKILDAEERARYLDEACLNQPEFRASIEELLADAATNGPFLEEPTSNEHLPEGIDFRGRYRLLEVLGDGGMGTVHRAIEYKGMRREVAIKFVRADQDGGRFRQRFLDEIRLLTSLRHRNIATVYAADETETGVPYFAMEYIQGSKQITDFCAEHKLSIQDRINLFQAVLSAVQYMHDNDPPIVHRDLKPNNILVDQQPEGPVPKVIDLGVATSEGLLHDSAGYRDYMAPEQWTRSGQVTRKSDIFSLGVVLHELLTGTLPQSVLARRLTPAEESAAETVLPVQSTTDPLGRTGLQELAAILRRALQHDPEARFRSCDEFAAELQRYLKHEPVHAYRESLTSLNQLIYDLSLLGRRNPLPSIFSVIAVFLLIVMGLLWQASALAEHDRLIQRHRSIERQVQLRERSRELDWQKANVADLNEALGFKFSGRDDEQMVSAFTNCWSTTGIELQPLWTIEMNGSRLAFMDSQRIAVAQRRDDAVLRPQIRLLETTRGEQVQLFVAQDALELPTFLTGRSSHIMDVAADISRQRLFALRRDGVMHSWDLDGSALVRATTAPKRGGLTVSPDGTHVITWNDNGLRLWDAETFAPLNDSDELREVAYARFSDDSQQILVSNEHVIQEVDAATFKPARFQTDRLGQLLVAALDNSLLVTLQDRLLRVYRRTATQLEEFILPIPDAQGLAAINRIQTDPDSVCTDGQLLALFNHLSSEVLVWDLPKTEFLGRLPLIVAEQGHVRIAISPDQRLLAVSDGQRVRAHTIHPSEIVARRFSGMVPIAGMQLGGDGQLYVARSATREPRIEAIDFGRPGAIRPRAMPISTNGGLENPRGQWAVSADGSLLAVAESVGRENKTRKIQIVNPRSGERLQDLTLKDESEVRDFASHLHQLAFGANQVLYGIGASRVLKWNLAKENPQPEVLESPASDTAEKTDANARLTHLVVGEKWCIASTDTFNFFGEVDVAIQVQGIADPSNQTVLLPAQGEVTALQLVHGGEQLAIGWRSGSLSLYQLPEITLIEEFLAAHQGSLNCIVETAPGQFVTGSDDGTIRFWNNAVEHTHPGQSLPTGHPVLDMVWLPQDGRLLIHYEGATSLHEWDLRKLRQKLSDVGLPASF